VAEIAAIRPEEADEQAEGECRGLGFGNPHTGLLLSEPGGP
jgi:hypothetical protein